MSNDNDAVRREKSRFSAGAVDTRPDWLKDVEALEDDELQLSLPIQALDEPVATSALDVQVGGGHYKSLAIQPVKYIHANKIPFIEGCIIKYATRWRDKGGVKDLEKIKHFVDLLIELEGQPNGGR